MSTPSPSPIEATPTGCRILLHVVPRASRTRVAGLHDGRLKLQVAAPPVDGEANDAIVRWAAKLFAVARDAVTIASGATGKRKALEVAGLDPDAARAALGLDELAPG
ncbi:MAG: DUF167 domain-containing protein [Deltaproteobacteria bacterium]|nr:DUF167 domain-containing protein [Deltaproteobacteria bacterium]